MGLLGGHAVPDWVTVLAEETQSARIIARPPVRSGAVNSAYDLIIRHGAGGLEVSETVIGSRLPRQCPELHIKAEGIFCLSREANSLATRAEADQFWVRLGDYLVDQHAAERRRQWPAGRWMSHGNAAADYQEAAEAIAAKNGWDADYAHAIENDEGWIAAALRRGVGPPGTSTCPCSRDGGFGTRRHRCKRRRSVESIIVAEHRRRRAERDHLNGLYMQGLRCCGRIDGCQLEAMSDVH
jgi:hypothetical protein